MIPQNLPQNFPQMIPQNPLPDAPPELPAEVPQALPQVAPQAPPMPPPPAPPPIPIPAPAQPDVMGQLAEAMTQLANLSAMQLTNLMAGPKLVNRPAPFSGERGDDARRFLAAFTLWGMSQGAGLNVLDEQGTAIRRRDAEWIRAALSFLQDDAAVWGAPAMEDFANGLLPFGGVWDFFREQFKARFESADEVVDAKEKLRVLWQDGSTVPEYAAQFKQLMTRTGYSGVDLRDRFYEHLTSRIKDELVHSARATTTLDELIIVATDIDTRVRQRRAEKEREKKRTGITPEMTTAPTPFGNPVSNTEPVAMNVDATRTREEFMRQMRGKCFGCGSSAHSKKDGHHERDLCTYCKRPGHREGVCMDKFLGRAKSQKVAAVLEGDISDAEAPEGNQPSGEEAGTVLTARPTLAQLLAQQSALTEQIGEWKEEDF